MFGPEYFYFGCLAVALVLAIRSADEALQKLGAALFAGWGFYSPLQYLIPDAHAVFWNLGLDAVLLAYVVFLFRRHRTPAAKRIGAVFGLMFAWHGVELIAQPESYALGLNLLFLAQLVILAGSSVAVLRGRRRERPHGRANPGTAQAEVIEWPSPDTLQNWQHDSTSVRRRHFAD